MPFVYKYRIYVVILVYIYMWCQWVLYRKKRSGFLAFMMYNLKLTIWVRNFNGTGPACNRSHWTVNRSHWTVFCFTPESERPKNCTKKTNNKKKNFGFTPAVRFFFTFKKWIFLIFKKKIWAKILEKNIEFVMNLWPTGPNYCFFLYVRKGKTKNLYQKNQE